ncbi:hypothetical protein CCR75_008962 [Bremia lactucae]|uniref:SCP domain-containing protein n=1 Tax=Bremia lactucae TaxID=4779 RepID=A0A976FKI4_BRELC|nr:hypothetical protein CCR75_008962 [Bremia lactucae]
MYHAFIVVLSTGVVAVLVASSPFHVGSQGRVMWQNNCDLYGNDIKSISGIPDVCGDYCTDTADCTHWTWTQANGGTCWLKNGQTASTSQSWGANCGYIIGRFSDSNFDSTAKHLMQFIDQNVNQEKKENFELLSDKQNYKSGYVKTGPNFSSSWSSYSSFGSVNKSPQTDLTFQLPTVTAPAPVAPAPVAWVDQAPVALAPVPSPFSPPPQKSGLMSSTYGLTEVETSEMLASINAYRSQNGRASLTIDSRLMSAAYVHSQDQASQCKMSHDGSDGSKSSDRISAQGYEWSVVAENVAAGQPDVASVMTSWWNSEGHRMNILKDDVVNVGFALSLSSTCKEFNTYWTQEFGAPMDANQY